MTQQALATRSGLSGRTIGSIERGEAENPSQATKYALERALGWAEDSYDDVLAGGEPALSERAEIVSDEDELFVYRALKRASPDTVRKVRKLLEGA